MKKNMKRLAYFICLMLSMSMLTACSKVQNNKKSATVAVETPTFFFHGWGSSVNAEKHMVNAASSVLKTSVVTAMVDQSGKVTLSGKLKSHTKPIVMVGYRDNSNPNYRRDAFYAYQAIQAVKKRYQFKKMNLVGHSMGNMSSIFLINKYHNRKSLPKIAKIVDIAGHFNGIRGMSEVSDSPLKQNGYPSKLDPTYQMLLPIKKIYPHAKVMNIFGDKQDGTHSDGPVAVNSAKSLRYLAEPNASHYEEHEILGKKAQHSQLHENPEVDRLLVGFLWKN